MQQTETITIQLPVDSVKRLEILAGSTEYSSDYHAAKAIEQYIELQEWQIRAIKDAVEEADSPDAKFIEHDDVIERLKKRMHQ